MRSALVRNRDGAKQMKKDNERSSRMSWRIIWAAVCDLCMAGCPKPKVMRSANYPGKLYQTIHRDPQLLMSSDGAKYLRDAAATSLCVIHT